MNTYLVLLLFIFVLWLMFSRHRGKRRGYADNGSTGGPDGSGNGEPASHCDNSSCDGGGDGGGGGD